MAPDAPFRDAVRTLIYGQGAGGGQSAYNVMHMIDPLLGYAGASVGGGPEPSPGKSPAMR